LLVVLSASSVTFCQLPTGAQQPCLAWLNPTKPFYPYGLRLLFARGSRAHATTQPEAHTIKARPAAPVEFSTPSMRAAPAGSCISTLRLYLVRVQHSTDAAFRPSWTYVPGVAARGRAPCTYPQPQGRRLPVDWEKCPIEPCGGIRTPLSASPGRTLTVSRVPVIARKALASEEGFGSLLSTGEQCLLEASPRDL
jgi:hypothetical protein